MAVYIITSVMRQLANNGKPASGAKIYVYDVGTTTLRSIYSDKDLTVSAANPIVCDAYGLHDIRYTATGSYKIVVTTSDDTPLYTRDNIDGGIPAGILALAIANGGTGATDATTALANLGGASAAELADLASDVAGIAGSLASSEKTHIATGTTAQRPASPTVGDIRFNTTTGYFEVYGNLGGWENIHTNAVARATTADVTAQTNQGTYISPDRLLYAPSVAQAYGRFVVTAGTPSLVAGFNFSATITDNGAGDFTLNFTTALANANYAVQVTPYGTTVAIPRVDTTTAQTAALFRIKFVDAAGSGTDPAGFYVTVHGVHA